MASGFIYLPRGWEFCWHSSDHDALLRAISDELKLDEGERALADFLRGMLPTSADLEMGVAWIRAGDPEQKWIERVLDVRQLSPDDQARFIEGVRRAKASANGRLSLAFAELLGMAEAGLRGEDPDARSHNRSPAPQEPGRIGPGWERDG
jgi:hypothetical protein